MEKFVSQKVLKMAQNEMENLTTPITSKKIGLIIKRKTTQRKPRPKESLVMYTKYLKNNTYQHFFTTSSKNKRMQYFPTHYMRPVLPSFQK